MPNLLLANPVWSIEQMHPILTVIADGVEIWFTDEQKLLARGFPAVTFNTHDEEFGDKHTYTWTDGYGYQCVAGGASDDPGLLQLVKEFLQACRDGTFEPHPPHPLA